MRNASILVAGMRALSNEVCKNIVLAGVGSITILEHEKITEQDLGAQFFLRENDLGRNVRPKSTPKSSLSQRAWNMDIHLALFFFSSFL